MLDLVIHVSYAFAQKVSFHYMIEPGTTLVSKKMNGIR